MPYAAPRPCPVCRKVGCNCRTRGTSTQRGYDRRWRKARLLFLREHPLCVECLAGGRTTAASHVDHVVPHRGNQRLFWDAANWQALCARHHSEKTARGE
jgi:5-methylcytosine-specific restriction protein A